MSHIMHWLHHWWPYSRVAHYLTPFHLPFAPIPTDVRTWKVEIDPPNATLIRPLPTSGKLDVSLHRILIEAGIALSPATSSWDPRSWFALYRYGADFAGTTPHLRFHTSVTSKDPRLTAVASEEVATGITCYMLREHCGLPHIADVYACIQRGELQYVDATLRSRPDYFCEDLAGETVIAESKGATGTRNTITSRKLQEGWNQVQNVAPVNKTLRASCGRLVVGTHFCVSGKHERSETTTILKDPDGPRGQEANPDSDEIVRIAYAKALRFMGQDVLAEMLLTRQDFKAAFPRLRLADERLPDVFGTPFLPLGITPFGDAIGLLGSVAKALFVGGADNLLTGVKNALDDVIHQRQHLDLDRVGFILTNGVMVIPDAEDLLWEY